MLRKGLTELATGANLLMQKTVSALPNLSRSGHTDGGNAKQRISDIYSHAMEIATPTKTNDDPDKMSDEEKKRIMRMIE